jgi:hypothetical protein
MAGFVIGLLIGILIGYGFSVVIRCRSVVGSLRIDTSDQDDGPYLFLELSKDVSEVYRRKHIMLEVNTENFIPHK